MDQFSFVFTIFFLLLGPVKLIPAFAGVTAGADPAFKRAVAIRAAVIATVVVFLVALVGTGLLSKYRISIDGLRIAGGLVLLVAALNTIFGKTQLQPPDIVNVTPMQVAISPMTTPIIVPHAGVAAILIFMMLAPQYPGIKTAVAISLAIVMVLDFLVMFFNSAVIKLPGLLMVLQVLGAVLIFMQVGMAVETMLFAVRHLAGIPGP